jgi:ABC-type spermidine/putrescine transport system permease subunit I
VAEALSRIWTRLATGLSAAILAVLLARPWWQPVHHHVFLLRDAACGAVLLPATALAWMLWAASGPPQWVGAAALVGFTAAGPAWAAVPLIALPALAALRRMQPALLDEARVGGAGWPRVVLALLLPRAAPGLVYGAVLALAPPGEWRMAAALLPLLGPWAAQVD